MLLSQRVTQICFFLFAAIAIFGGCVQMYLGEPDTTQRLDNIHRFLAGIYLGCGFICFWTALNIQKQNTLVLLICVAVMLGGLGRLISMSKVGLPEPGPLWLVYVSLEIVVPLIAITGQLITNKRLSL